MVSEVGGVGGVGEVDKTYMDESEKKCDTEEMGLI